MNWYTRLQRQNKENFWQFHIVSEPRKKVATSIISPLYLYMKKDPFTDTASYNPVRLMVRKIRYALFEVHFEVQVHQKFSPLID